MPVLIQVDGDQRASSHPSQHSHLWFHQICNRTPHGGSLIHPLKHQGQNPFLQSKCVLKISSLTAALEKFACIYMFIKHGKMSSSNLSWSDPIILTEKNACVWRLTFPLQNWKLKRRPAERRLLFLGVAEQYERLHHFAQTSTRTGLFSLKERLGQHLMHYKSPRGVEKKLFFVFMLPLWVTFIFNGFCTTWY